MKKQSSNPQPPCKETGLMVYACNPSPGDLSGEFSGHVYGSVNSKFIKKHYLVNEPALSCEHGRVALLPICHVMAWDGER